MADGCYVPQYLPCSFKGVTFETMEVTSEHGRRGAEGEFPFGENTAYADLGRKIRRYTIKGRFANNAHVASAETLIVACESPGPGILVHPTRGALNVACTKLSVSDDVMEEQGVTYVDMEFVEASLFAFGAAALFSLGVSAIFAAIGAAFGANFAIESVRYYRVRDIYSTMSNRMNAVKREFEKYNARNPKLSGWNAIATMQDIVDDPSSIRKASDAFTAFKRSMATINGVATGAEKYASFKTIANDAARVSGLPQEVGDTDDAVNVMVRLLAMVNMVNAALETKVTNLLDALNQYDEVVQIISEELVAARAICEDDLYLELRKFETGAKTELLKRAYGLPALVEYNFSKSVHSLVAAYEIYGDAKRFGEIESFNKGTWPFLVGPTVIAPRA